MKALLAISLLMLLSGCFSTIVQSTKPNSPRYSKITLPDEESTYYAGKTHFYQPVDITTFRSLSFLNRTFSLEKTDGVFYLKEGWYQAIAFCHHALMPDGTTPDSTGQIYFHHGPFPQITFKAQRGHNYVLDCIPYNKGQEATFSLTDTKTGKTKVLNTTWAHW